MKTGRGNLASGVVSVCHEWERCFVYQNHRLIATVYFVFGVEGRVLVHRSTVQYTGFNPRLVCLSFRGAL